MGKIKKFLSDNKLELQVVAYGTVMFISGIYLGKKYEGEEWNNTLIMLGDTGLNPKKLIDDNLYTISVTKTKIK